MMNFSKLLVAVIAAFGAFILSAEPNAAYTADATVADALTLEGEYIIDVASGVTVTYTGEISGTGPLRKTGDGMLVLNPAGGDNAFTEGVQISQGVIRADTAGALGTGEIFLDGTLTAKDSKNRTYGFRRQIFFNADGAIFANKIRIEGYDSKGSWPYTSSFIRTDVNTTLSGDIDLSSLSQYGPSCNASFSCGSSSPSSALLHFTKGVSWPGKMLRLNAYGDVRFDGPVVVETLSVNYIDDLHGSVILGSKENMISTIVVRGANITAGDDFVLNGTKFTVNKGYSSTSRSALNLNGKNQSLASLTFGSGDNAYVRSSTPTALFLTGESTSRTSYQTLSEKVSLVVDAADYPEFTQTFAKRAHTTSGTLSVSNGTLAVTLGATFKNVGEIHVGPSGNLTADASSMLSGMFAGVTNVVVDGKMTLGANISTPFTDEAVDLTLGENAELTIPDTMVLRVKTLTVAGKKVGNKTKLGVNGLSLEQLKGGTIVVDDGSSEVVSAVWTGNGGDTFIAAVANWSTDPSLPALDDMMTFAEFATGGNEASVDRAVSFYGIRLSAVGGFTFSKASDSASVSIGEGGLATTPPSADSSAVYTFKVPLITENKQVLDIAAGTVVKADAGFKDVSGGRIDKKGAGEFSISGNSVIAGSLVHNEGTLRFAGDIGAPVGVSQGTATKFGVSTITVPGNIEGLTTILDGVTFHKPVWMAGRGDVDDKTVNWLQFGVASTNVFKEDAVFYTNVGYLNLDSDSALVFEKGGDFSSTVNFCNGTLIVKGGKVTAVTGNGLYLRKGSIRLETKGNQITLRGRSVRKAEFLVDYAVTNRYLEFDTDYPQIYMNGTVQHCTTFRATSGSKIWGGEGPAKLIVSDGSGTEDTSYMYGGIEGNVSLVQATANTFSIYSDSKSTGDLEVRKGTLNLGITYKKDGITIDSTGAWRNGTNIVVRGTGKLKTSAANQFNREHTVMKLSEDGVVEIPEGVMQVVRELHIDGVRVPGGVYGGAGAPNSANKAYAKHFAGAGILKTFCGMTIVVR